jgi:nitrite reductase/ring-hydroxylating ferredoxin subunit
MAKRPTPITKPYDAYHRQDSNKTYEELTRVGRGTPCGEYLRRFWQPIIISSELGDTPSAIRILGENLVVFRDGRGKIGVLERRCSHRGVSLEFGKIMETGIACCYHGWQYDVDGRILDTPGEPSGSNLKNMICHGAYPTHEHRGLVFAYMGPPDDRPDFPTFDAFEGSEDAFVGDEPDYRLWTRHNPCNWLQVRENEMDPVHLTFLHTRLFGVQFAEVYGESPATEWQETPIGMLYASTRRWKENLYTRCNDLIMPNIVRVAGIEDAEGETLFDRRASSLNWVVPIDDENCMTIGYSDINKKLTSPDGNGYIDRMARSGGHAVGAGDVGQTGEPTYEERQRAPGDWDAWVSQGPITKHHREHLGSTDVGVSLYRTLLRREIRKVDNGEVLVGSFNEAGNPVTTYCHNTVISAPREDGNERDQCLAFGREVTRRVLAGDYPKDISGMASRDALRDFAFQTPKANHET